MHGYEWPAHALIKWRLYLELLPLLYVRSPSLRLTFRSSYNFLFRFFFSPPTEELLYTTTIIQYLL